MLSGRTLRALSATIVVGLCVFGGCSPKRGAVIPLGVNSEVAWIEADDSGAWIALTTRASIELGKPLPPNYCFLRRYDRNGTMAKEVALGVGLFRRFEIGNRGALALVVEDSLQAAHGSASLSVDLWLAGENDLEWCNVGRCFRAARLALRDWGRGRFSYGMNAGCTSARTRDVAGLRSLCAQAQPDVELSHASMRWSEASTVACCWRWRRMEPEGRRRRNSGC
jgi:hypothetical protein